MLFKPALLLTGLVAASRALEFGAASHQQNNPLTRRTTQCKEVEEPDCEKSCGPGYKTCVKPNMCFNPSAGETCCESGTFCPAGSYCSDAGCCPNNMKLEDCMSAVTRTLIHQEQSSTEEPTTTSTTSTTSTSTTTNTVTSYVPTQPTEEPEPTTPSTTPRVTNPTSATGSGSWPSSTAGNNATVTTPSDPPQQTDNAAVRVEGASLALGLGLVAVLAALI
ncbi:hypothetical protein CISG_04500 [Coccidioides immitis RMSCC 3703]|uniref:Prp 4 CRoW domain-containing protein n=1 Tax=Coccidioides immitis RMSCC 3703 TaxID=454286 RepID=A0A0J8QPH8_COCIT|nr:hypothetical protein CISG_04500 [Coccidioides immitis RMSCC 3703]